MASASNANPLYDTYAWTLSPNGTLYVLNPGMGMQSARGIRLGRAMACTHRSKHLLPNGSYVSALVFKVEKHEQLASSSAEAAMQSPSHPTVHYYVVQKGKCTTFEDSLPGFKSHDDLMAAFGTWHNQAANKDNRQGKWMKTFLTNTVRPAGADPRLSNSSHSSAPRALEHEFKGAASPPLATAAPLMVFGAARGTTTPRSAAETSMAVANLTSSQPEAAALPGELQPRAHEHVTHSHNLFMVSTHKQDTHTAITSVCFL